ncbi:hypothetical protein B0I35DRAFT_474907 [Stachybotrys elegans]|uniref:Uncharacterized protein n=1 Tax=Stachybotrys elegans TaxID=80388 RepID=A0A8K0WV29_9HYPO|nr:hypothetical protein B0I35DRAFT_474907 [Stachybotrys elegans]
MSSGPTFCTYCGKSFTRKEHLERHIPSHTNVKPYRCPDCFLAFSRKDLLQRHTMTYHEPGDNPDLLLSLTPSQPGRNPIACQNCANAKTGCDKRVPCSRCAEKALPCEARFARRSSKAAHRAAQTFAALQRQIGTQAQRQHQQQPGRPQSNPTSRDDLAILIEPDNTNGNLSLSSSKPDLHMQLDTTSFNKLDPISQTFLSPELGFDGNDNLWSLTHDFNGPAFGTLDHVGWNKLPMEFDMSGTGMQLGSMDLLLSPPGQNFSDATSFSFPPAAPSEVSSHTRTNSSGGLEAGSLGQATSFLPEFEAVIAAESAWPLARCNPVTFSRNCPRTAILHLECLERKSRIENAWNPLESLVGGQIWDPSEMVSVACLTAGTRDIIIAVTQSFLHKALEIHRSSSPRASVCAGQGTPGISNYIISLPSTRVLDSLLRCCMRNLSSYFCLAPRGVFNPNEIMGEQASTLLVLLMIALGASGLSICEARELSTGLAETCRISLFDTIEKNVELSADPIALKCAMLFTLLGAWSGDKWLMDIAMGQRGMYLSMLRHSGMLEPGSSARLNLDTMTDTEICRSIWLEREAQSRLVYNWVIVDQELSLFHDTMPLLSIPDLQCPLPSPEDVWKLRTTDEWLGKLQAMHGNMSPGGQFELPEAASLFGLFQDFLQDKLSCDQESLTAFQLRLLLHPIQNLLCHTQQTMSCFPEILTTRRPAIYTGLKTNTRRRLEEIQLLLEKWYGLAHGIFKLNPNDLVIRVDLVLFHLVSLNTITNFPQIEQLARWDNSHTIARESSLRQSKYIHSREEATDHCKQILDLVRQLPIDHRPPWWPAAIYRVTLILWVDALTQQKLCIPSPTHTPPGAHMHPIPASMEAPGTAGIDGPGMSIDGATMPLDRPASMLQYGIQAIEEGRRTRFSDGIKRKLTTLGDNWKRESS